MRNSSNDMNTRLLLCAALAATLVSGCTAKPAPTAEASPTEVVSSSAATGNPMLRAIDGDVAYYEKFDNGLPTSSDFFPIGVWSESVVDDTGWPVDRAAGINVYVQPTPDTDLPRIALHGMYSISSWAPDGAPSAGFFTEDEADMWGGMGETQWTGNYPGQGDICIPADSKCGFTIMAQASAAAPPNAMRYTNFGKGIVFWSNRDEGARFVNEYQDVVSADIYWFTDPGICSFGEAGALLGTGADVDEADCRLAANYCRTVEYVRSLVDPAGSRPVWNFVELSHPSSTGGYTITPDQIRGAVWSSLVAGARGIVYFNHAFGGDCQTQHVLRDCGSELRDAVTAINAQVSTLAPVLNAPFADNVARVSDNIDASAKLYDGSLFVLTTSARADRQTASIEFLCPGTTSARVVDENRTVPIVDGVLIDEFVDGNAVHIYEIDQGGTCGLG